MWPLVNDWEILKETAVGSSEGGLVYLRYTYRYRSQFDEPNDDWLEAVETTSDELLGAYTKAEIRSHDHCLWCSRHEEAEQSF